MIKYSSNSAIKSVSVPYPFSFDLTSEGDGTGTVSFYCNPSVTSTLYVTGNAKMYTDAAGTLGECTDKSFAHAAYLSGLTMYIRLTSGSAKIYAKTKLIEEIRIGETATKANAPLVSGDFSNMTPLLVLELNAKCHFDSSITKLVNAKRINIRTSMNKGYTYGSVSGLTAIDVLILHDYSVNRIAGATMNITGTVENFTEHPWCELVDDEEISIFVTGEVPDVELFYGTGFRACTATIDAWTNCVYIENNCPNITVNTVIGLTKMGYFQPSAIVLTETQVNQILADLRANVATVKGYSPSETSRTFDVRGAVGTAAPTGQGLIDKQFLIDWVGGSGQTNNVYTR